MLAQELAGRRLCHENKCNRRHPVHDRMVHTKHWLWHPKYSKLGILASFFKVAHEAEHACYIKAMFHNKTQSYQNYGKISILCVHSPELQGRRLKGKVF